MTFRALIWLPDTLENFTGCTAGFQARVHGFQNFNVSLLDFKPSYKAAVYVMQSFGVWL